MTGENEHEDRPGAHVHEALPGPALESARWYRRREELKAQQEATKARLDDLDREAGGELAHGRTIGEQLKATIADTERQLRHMDAAIEHATAQIDAAAAAENLQARRALLTEGESHADAFMEASAGLQDAIEQTCAHLIETHRAGIQLVRAITKAKQLVPPGGRITAGDAREALAVAQHLADRVQTEIARRVGRELWPGAPAVPPGVANCPLRDQHAGIVSNALVELAATLNINPEA